MPESASVWQRSDSCTLESAAKPRQCQMVAYGLQQAARSCDCYRLALRAVASKAISIGGKVSSSSLRSSRNGAYPDPQTCQNVIQDRDYLGRLRGQETQDSRGARPRPRPHCFPLAPCCPGNYRTPSHSIESHRPGVQDHDATSSQHANRAA